MLKFLTGKFETSPETPAKWSVAVAVCIWGIFCITGQNFRHEEVFFAPETLRSGDRNAVRSACIFRNGAGETRVFSRSGRSRTAGGTCSWTGGDAERNCENPFPVWDGITGGVSCGGCTPVHLEVLRHGEPVRAGPESDLEV